MNLILIGYRGTGKSSVAKILSEKLHAKLISTDELIVKKAGMGIPEIVEKHGWEHFRNLESGIVKEIISDDDLIVDSGGGVVLRDENIKSLRKNSKIVLLTADTKTIASRIKDGKNRPSLTGKKSFIEEIEEVLKERKPIYDKAADFRVDTSKLRVSTVAKRIIDWLNRCQ